MKKNHPEYTGAYRRELTNGEKIIFGAIGITASMAFYGWAGYKMYNFFKGIE